MNKTVTFNVQGIMCPRCVKKICDVVGALAGVEGVEVSEDFKQVKIQFEEEKSSAGEIKHCIEEIEGKKGKNKFNVLGEEA